MSIHSHLGVGVGALLLAAGIGSDHSLTEAFVFPGASWERVAVPESVGFSSAGLAVVRQYIRSTAAAWPKRTPTGLMVVVGGKVLLDYGDTAEVSYVASVRKSILAMLFGKYVAQGRIRLDDTLADLHIDDVGGLLPSEQEATVADLLAARSGVYHPPSNGWAGWIPPARGSQAHGRSFFYNNWGFNALGTIFEARTGQNIYDALEVDLARPIGMEDFRRDIQRKEGDPAQSTHLAYHMRLSTRDMARIGYLMLREGNWAGKQLIPKEWVQKITSQVTPLEQMNPESLRTRRLAYGYLWWIFDDAEARGRGPLHGAYTATGAFGQYVTVIPELNVVIAHKTLPGADRDVSDWDYLRFVDLLIAAACDPCSTPVPGRNRETTLPLPRGQGGNDDREKGL
jgi:CubicO group peptidase (beta-lactamase class C family)